jgi:hypothetical protein
MAQAKLVRIPIRARITGASLTTSTKSIRSTSDAPAAGHAARRIGLDQTLCEVWAEATSAHKRGVPAVSRRVP